MLPADNSCDGPLLTRRVRAAIGLGITQPGPWLLLLAAVGSFDAWGSRFNLNPDGISYIEMAQHALAGAPDGLINGYWSPGYPALIAPTLAVGGHDWAAAVPALHVTNLLLYFLSGLLALFLLRSVSAPGLSGYTTAVGAAVFGVVAIECIGVGIITPDFAVMLVVLLIACCCIQLERSSHSWRWSVALGTVLGAGYWIKGIVLPLGALLLVALLIVPPTVERARRKVGVAALVFAIVSLPLVILVSARLGRVTVGDVGRLNYAWEVDQVTPFVGWVGDSTPRFGAPLHGPRVLAAQPQTLEFARPIRASYPLWFDPSYWYAGVLPRFDATGQWRVLRQGLHDLASLAHRQWVLIVSLLAFWFASAPSAAHGGPRSRVLPVLGGWSVAAALGYALVHVEPRYLAGFVMVGVVVGWSSLSRRVPRRGTPLVAMAVVIALSVSLVRHLRDNTGGYQVDYRPDYLVDAGRLRDAGVVPGDPVAVVGDAFEAYAAFVLGSPIIAQVVDSTGFWQLAPMARSGVAARLSGVGVKAVLANNVDPAMVSEGWRILVRADSSNLGVLLLRRPE